MFGKWNIVVSTILLVRPGLFELQDQLPYVAALFTCVHCGQQPSIQRPSLLDLHTPAARTDLTRRPGMFQALHCVQKTFRSMVPSCART
jgi:hypothetical protein